MLTEAQQKWVDHLSDTNKVEVFPFDPTSEEKFQEIKKEVQNILGTEVQVLHRGASGLGISGQREIDIYIPVPVEKMWSAVDKIKAVWGEPKSNYPEERTKWIRHIDGTYIEVMVTNEQHPSWINGEKFYSYLQHNPDALEEYRKLKEDAAGVTTREYYRRKIEFINSILVQL